MQQALDTVNPRYNEGREYQINCQRCALAYEEQRKGLAVEAQPNNDAELVRRGELAFEHGNWWADDSGFAYYHPVGHVSFTNAYEGQTWDRIGNSRSAAKAVEKLTTALESQGDGARFLVNVVWKNGGGHVFNAEVVNGTAVFVDPQSGTVRDIDSTLARAKMSGRLRPAYSRVDNRKLKDGVGDWAFRRM